MCVCRGLSLYTHAGAMPVLEQLISYVLSPMQALAGVVTLDLVGVIRGWQFFDHAGHLGGVLFAA